MLGYNWFFFVFMAKSIDRTWGPTAIIPALRGKAGGFKASLVTE